MTLGANKSRYLIGKETTYGTSVSVDTDIGLVQEATDRIEVEEIPVPQGIGSREDEDVKTGTMDAGDSVTFHIQHGRFLELALGSVTHTSSSDDWKHTFSIDSPPSFTSEISQSGDSDEGTEKTGNLVDSMTISWEQNGILTGEITTLASGASTVTTASTYQKSDLPTFAHGDVTVQKDSTDLPEVQNFSITMAGEVNRSYGTGKTAEQGEATRANFTFSGTVGLDNNAYNELIINQTSFELTMKGDNGISFGSGQRKVEITLEKCQVTSHEKSISVGELTFVDIEGRGTLKNAESVDNISDTEW